MSPSLSSLLLIASLSGASAAACASVFDVSKDYFASYAPFVPKYATTFSIRYGKSYKLVNVTADGATTIVTLSVCGAALPSRSELGLSSSASLVQLSLPLTAGLQSTTYAPYIESIGARSNITAISGASYFSSVCLRAGVQSGTVSDVGDESGSFVSTSAAAQAAGVIFRGLPQPWSGPLTDREVPVAETKESSPLGVAEYLHFFAAFFDAEKSAASVFSIIESRFACTVQKVQSLVTRGSNKPKVLWGYRFESQWGGPWYVASSDAWYSPLITAAGGEVLVRADGKTSLTDDEFIELAKDATVFIYTGSDWDANVAALSGVLGDKIKSIPAVANKKVFDILGSGVNAWFDSRPAAPDAVVQDLLLAFHPSAAVTKAPVFIRNVFAQAAGTLADASTCTAAVKSVALKVLSSACGADQKEAAAGLDSTTQAIIGGVVGGTVGLLAIGAAVAALMGAFGTSATAAKVVLAAGEASSAGATIAVRTVEAAAVSATV